MTSLNIKSDWIWVWNMKIMFNMLGVFKKMPFGFITNDIFECSKFNVN